MASEQWRRIPQYPAYEVSDHGRVRSYFDPTTGEIDRVPRRFLKQSTSVRGYKVVQLRNGRGWKLHKIHRLVLMAFVGQCPEGFEVCHRDNNPLNNHLDNLAYDTHAENMAERKGSETWKRQHRLAAPQVLDIRNRRAAGISLDQLATEYDLTPQAISYISKGQTYASVGGPRVHGRAQSGNGKEPDNGTS